MDIFMTPTMWGYIIAGFLILCIIFVKKVWPAYKDDNVVEETAEEIIKDTTGVSVDLTPGDSPTASSSVTAAQDQKPSV